MQAVVNLFPPLGIDNAKAKGMAPFINPEAVRI